MDTAAYLLPATGLVAGLLLGFVARRNFFCTLSALERHWYGENSEGLRTWVLAAVVAAVTTQVAVATGVAETSGSMYLAASLSLPAAIIGGLAFGVGMSLVGTCGYGVLVRLGGGSLKSLVVVLVIAIVAMSTSRGLLAVSRTGFLDRFAIDLSFAGNQSLPAVMSSLVGIDLSVALTVILIAIPAIWVFADRNFRSNWGAFATAAVIGLVICSGWVVTTSFGAVSFDPVQIESASYVGPVSDSLLQFIARTGTAPDYGVGVVLGTVAGAAVAARTADNVRWEACDDAAELARHIAGAALMGFGGILALGCTVGQGMSAASLLATSVPFTVISIGIGARLGLAWLIEGSPLAPFRRVA